MSFQVTIPNAWLRQGLGHFNQFYIDSAVG